MRRFNPDKELYKIRYGNRNKVIISICFLLIVISIGSTFALYQVRHTKRIIYTTVSPFYSKDLQLAVYIDEVKQEDFPKKEEGYLYEGIECDNDDISASFNNDTWKLNLEVGKPNKCNIKFTSSPFKAFICKDIPMSECLLKEELHYNKELAYDDPDNNARYYGKAPANYIWFNCDDYSNPTENTCERWRIIGSFKNTEKVNEDGESTTKQNLVKIIKAESLDSFQWDINYVNNWDTSSLQISLISYYNGIKIGENKVLSSNSKSLIENIKWHLGGYGHVTGVLTAEWYELERENNAYQTNPVTWNGKIALSYPSDYGYATSGGTTGRKTCIENSVYYWNEDVYKTNCVDNDWLYLSNGNMWLLPPNYLNSHDAVSLYKNGKIDNRSTQSSVYVYPSLYLTHDTKISGGDGTYENPYTIAIQ